MSQSLGDVNILNIMYHEFARVMNTYHFTSDPSAGRKINKMADTLFTCAAQFLSILIFVLCVTANAKAVSTHNDK